MDILFYSGKIGQIEIVQPVFYDKTAFSPVLLLAMDSIFRQFWISNNPQVADRFYFSITLFMLLKEY